MPAASPTSSPGSGQPGKERGGRGRGRTRSQGARRPPPGSRCEPPRPGTARRRRGSSLPPPRAAGGGADTGAGPRSAAARPRSAPRRRRRRAPVSAGPLRLLPPRRQCHPESGQPSRGGRCPRPPPRLPDSPLLTRCLAAARPGQARAAATNAALFGARRLHVGRRAQARQPRAVLPAQRHLRLLPARGRNSGGLAALTQHHADAGLPAMLPAPRSRQPPGLLRMRCRRPAPAGSLPRPAAPGTRGAAAGGGTTDTRHTHTHTRLFQVAT